MNEKNSEKPKENEIHIDEDNVSDAVRRRDWPGLRKLSLKVGGFGEERGRVWSFLLHAQHSASSESDGINCRQRRRRRRTSTNEAERERSEEERGRSTSRSSYIELHPDERQIKLDTDRSFVLYPVEEHRDREELQNELNELITSVFRRHPRLSYFQGYHDIITVLFLTLPKDKQLLCAEKISLHRLRDAMGKGLEPLLGLLQILKYLLRLADSDYAALLERNSPLPYFALSNLLTLFSHDVPTLPLIQHVLDFLLCRPPIAALYLAAAIILARKAEALRMEEEGDEGMLHSLLSSLPELSDGNEMDKSDKVPKAELLGNSDILDEEILRANPKVEDDVMPISGQYEERKSREEDVDTSSSETQAVQSDVGRIDLENADYREEDEDVVSADPPELQSLSVVEDKGSQETKNEAEALSMADGPLSLAPPHSSSETSSFSSPDPSNVPPSPPSSRPPSSLSHASSTHTRRPKAIVSLPALLAHADALLAQYPPTTPALHVDAIIGPQSVLTTWSEDPSDMASDAEAEAMVMHPELVVRPFVDPDEAAAEGKEGADGSHVGKGRRKPRWGRRRARLLDKKTLVAGAVVALSVAVAVYSIRAHGAHGAGFGGLDAGRAERNWRRAGKVGKLIGGAFIGGSERLLGSFGW